MNNVETSGGRPTFRAVTALPTYTAVRCAVTDLEAVLDPAVWQTATVAHVDQFHPKSSAHRPAVVARMLHSEDALHVKFDVDDRYVRSTLTAFQSRVSRDSCVEFFVQPAGADGYFNFEINAGGTLLVYFVEDPTPGDGDRLFRQYTVLPRLLGDQVRIEHSLPSLVEPEIQTAVAWMVTMTIPASAIEAYAPGAFGRRNTPWRCNFFKCGDETSHPHWAAWANIGERLRFHQPNRFGWLEFK